MKTNEDLKSYWIAYNKFEKIYFTDSISDIYEKTFNMITAFCKKYEDKSNYPFINLARIYIEKITIPVLQEILQESIFRCSILSYINMTLNSNKQEQYDFSCSYPQNCYIKKEKTWKLLNTEKSLKIILKNPKPLK